MSQPQNSPTRIDRQARQNARRGGASYRTMRYSRERHSAWTCCRAVRPPSPPYAVISHATRRGTGRALAIGRRDPRYSTQGASSARERAGRHTVMRQAGMPGSSWLAAAMPVRNALANKSAGQAGEVFCTGPAGARQCCRSKAAQRGLPGVAPRLQASWVMSAAANPADSGGPFRLTKRRAPARDARRHVRASDWRWRKIPSTPRQVNRASK